MSCFRKFTDGAGGCECRQSKGSHDVSYPRVINQQLTPTTANAVFSIIPIKAWGHRKNKTYTDEARPLKSGDYLYNFQWDIS